MVVIDLINTRYPRCCLFRFWSLWNLPVHRWCVRHLYKPLLHAGNSRTTAMLVKLLLWGA